jgi:hypothetical protein
MKVSLTVSGVTKSGDTVVVSIEGGGSLSFKNHGKIAEKPPVAGSKIEVTLSADKYEQLQGGSGKISGTFHGVVSEPAQSGAQARREDFKS